MNNKIVLTIGTFDIPHYGHFELFKRSKQMGDRLYVGINSDEFVQSYKNKKPIMTENERYRTLEHVKYIDKIFVNFDNGHTLIKKVNPDIITIGSDWYSRDYKSQINVGDEIMNKVIYLPYTKSISTTKIKNRI